MIQNLPFTPEMMMADIIHSDYRLIPIISRFGIRFGFANKSVCEVCELYDINLWFFLEIINSYNQPSYFPQNQLKNFSVSLIIGYLSATHEHYINDKMPHIQEYIDNLEATEEIGTTIKLLNDFYKEYAIELKNHLEHEDKNIFPYVLQLEEAYEKGKASTELLHRIRKEPIEHYERGHDDMEAKLSDLKNLIIKFLPPMNCYDQCQTLLTELFRLEKDLSTHTLIEDRVLIPKVKLLEQLIIKQSEDAE